jgi:hypothetical protein
MNDKVVNPGDGNVSMRLNNMDVVLVPSAGAAQSISRMHGGLRPALDAIQRLDLDAITNIVSVGLGPKGVSSLGGKDRIPKILYEAGLTDTSGEIIVKCINYVSILINGGRPLNTDDVDGDKLSGE